MTDPDSKIVYRAYGRCHCKNISYEFSGEVLTCFACHCVDCQASNGSAFTQNLIVPVKSLKLVSGELSTFSYTHQNRILKVYCCKQCVSVLWLIFADSEEYASVQLGTLNEKAQLAPIAHIWKSQSVEWLRLDDHIPCFDTEPDFQDLETLWRNQEEAKKKAT